MEGTIYKFPVEINWNEEFQLPITNDLYPVEILAFQIDPKDGLLYVWVKMIQQTKTYQQFQQPTYLIVVTGEKIDWHKWSHLKSTVCPDGLVWHLLLLNTFA